MIGALVFLAAFFVSLVLTIFNPSIPPGLSIYSALGFPETDYLIFGYPVPIFAASVFNGIIYGIVVWLFYSIVNAATKKKHEVVIKQESLK
ncbi:MAG: hypothetical protein QFX35_06695 [Candidatus Verstraetearchaeota archaeon]|nr:hypothetical protein [Candidatus Verstraetearchaeota archaeon]